jgi:hypothetical protein
MRSSHRYSGHASSGEDGKLSAPVANRVLLRRLIIGAVVLYPVTALVCHFGFGWSWALAIWTSLAGAVSSVFLGYRRQRT